METNGSRIKKNNPTLYEELEKDTDGSKKKEIKDGLETKKNEQKTDKEELEELKKKTGDDLTEEVGTKIKELEEVIAKRNTEIEIAENIDGNL
jgi:hypothetical protein